MPLQGQGVGRPEEHDQREVLAQRGRAPAGAQAPDEAIVYMAHWDHLGNHARSDEHARRRAGDNIYNGAIDNATGVAGILEIAEAFAQQDPKPERSLVFLAVTLEESGLLGSKYYVAHPAVPLDKTVAVINLDAMPVIGKAKRHDRRRLRQFASWRTSSSRSPTSRAASLHAEATPEDGFYFRSDHFNFAKAGVPALYAKGGDDLVEGGTAAGARRRRSTTARTATTSPPTSTIRRGSSTA